MGHYVRFSFLQALCVRMYTCGEAPPLLPFSPPYGRTRIPEEEPKPSTWTRARVQSRPPEPRSVLSVRVTFSVGMGRFHGADRMFDGREVREAELEYPRPKKEVGIRRRWRGSGGGGTA